MPESRNQSMHGLIGEALRETVDLARKEATLFRAEVSANLRTLLIGLAMMVGAAAFAVAALVLFTGALVAWLATLVDSQALAALIVGGVMALVALGLVLYARRTLALATLTPARTVRSLRRDSEILSERVV